MNVVAQNYVETSTNDAILKQTHFITNRVTHNGTLQFRESINKTRINF
jgi:hypothetical protein